MRPRRKKRKVHDVSFDYGVYDELRALLIPVGLTVSDWANIMAKETIKRENRVSLHTRLYQDSEREGRLLTVSEEFSKFFD
jgi:hypothetical protein